MTVSPALNLPPPAAAAIPSPARLSARADVRDQAGALSQVMAPMITASVVALCVVLAIHSARSADLVVALWAANGIAAGVWLRSGRGLQFDLSFGAMVAAGILAGEILGGNTLNQSAVFTVANMIEIVAAVVLARRFAPSLSFANVWTATRLVASTALIAPLPAAAFVAVALIFMRDAPVAITFQTWWVGHALGLLALLPVIVSVDRRVLGAFQHPLKLLEWVVVIGLVLGLAYLIYFDMTAPLAFLLNPLLVLVAVRLRAPGVGLAMLVISGMQLGSLLHAPADVVQAANAVPVAARVMNAQLMLLFAGVPFLLVAALLNERDHLSARARAGQRRAEAASQSKSRLLANVAHEIKSPVAGVIGIGDLWSSGQLGPVTPQQKEMADMLVRTARQVETLAHDLLDVARAESGAVKVEIRPTDICGVIEDVRRTTAQRPEARALELSVDFAEPHLVALADSQRITQVIDNLATNAMKYGASGGVIRFHASRVGDRIRIEVTDKGRGLSEAKQVELFEPFNRLGLERSTVEGHGIGLALSKRLVELQDGAIGVISAPGEGATFWIELPSI